MNKLEELLRHRAEVQSTYANACKQFAELTQLIIDAESCISTELNKCSKGFAINQVSDFAESLKKCQKVLEDASKRKPADLVKHQRMVRDMPERLAGRRVIEPIAKNLLLNSNMPVPTRSILEAIIDNGYCVGGKRPEANLSAHLCHIDAIKNVKGKGWVHLNNPQTTRYVRDMDSTHDAYVQPISGFGQRIAAG